jgi:hypothetical protein
MPTLICIRFEFPRMSGAFLGIVLSLVCSFGQMSQAATLWTGPDIEFIQSDTNFADELIPGVVSLARGYSQWLYNPDAGDQGPGAATPTDTAWAFGTLDNYGAYYYQSFDSLRNGDLSDLLVGNPMVVHLTNEDIYLSLTFSNWPQHGGFIAYTRSTPAVTITTPTNGMVFAAPAKVKISAAAALAVGTVTNVEIFANLVSLGSTKSAQFSVTTNLAAGQYALTAVETAGGISVTSLVVNISVVTPVAVALSSPRMTGSQFAFDYTANPGLQYVVQYSTNLVNWQSLATNIPADNPVHFTNSLASDGAQYYRVGLLPNP